MPVITAADMRRFAPRAAPRVVNALVAHGDAGFARWGLTTAPRLRMFMAQAKVESAGFTVLFEDMTYTAARIHAVWPTRFPTLASATRFAHAPEALAEQVYGDRLGNRPGTDDGWTCRGQGLLDTTGRANLAALAAHMGASLDDTRARLTADDGMVACAAATFHMLGCLPFADRGDVLGCSKRINGGLIGLPDRRAAFALAGRVWPALRPVEPAATPARPVPTPAAVVEPAIKPELRPTPEPVDLRALLVALGRLFGLS